MELDVMAANAAAAAVTQFLIDGYVDVLDVAGNCLARCRFADPAFAEPKDGACAASPFLPAIAEADGKPARFEAYDVIGHRVMAGTAGYKDDQPVPEMAFKTRQIIEGADVLVESFIFSVAQRDT